MKISVQTDNLKMLDEALNSDCDKIRFGSEFCEFKVPTLATLEKAYVLVRKEGKDFAYITPRVSTASIENIRKQLSFLDKKGEMNIISNDLGTLSILEQYSNLKPHLGRQLVYVPARCPWPEIGPKSFLAKRRWARIFYQTSLNYKPSIRFFQNYGVKDVDVDWIPNCFKHYYFLVRNGLALSVYLHLIPVTITRKCHTARFLKEENLWTCSRPCNNRAFLLKERIMHVEFYLQGNTVFSYTRPSQSDVRKLRKIGASELVIVMNPITKIESRQDIDELIGNQC